MVGPVQVGYLLPTRDLVATGHQDPTVLIELARRAESLGFDSVWAGDSPIARPRADPLVLLAAIAAVTERVVLGTAVLLPALRHPVLLAHQLATLDQLCSGRLILGVGGGFPMRDNRTQFGAVGVDYTTRISRMTEAVEVMRQLWSGAPDVVSGSHFRVEGVELMPTTVQRPGPPIWFAGSGERGLRRVARLADGWLPYSPTAARYAGEWKMIRATTDRSVTPALYATVCLDDDPARARLRLRAGIERYYNRPLEDVEAVQAVFAGPAAQTADRLNTYLAAGVRHLVIRTVADDHAAALDDCARRLLPLLELRRLRCFPESGDER